MKKRLRLIKLRVLRLKWVLLLVSTFAVAGAFVVQRAPFFGWVGLEDQELSAYDSGLKFWTKNVQPDPDIVVVGIDDQTLRFIKENPYYSSRYGKWIYAREVWADLLHILEEQGAKSVVYDLIFSESAESAELEKPFVQALRHRKIPVYLGFDFVPSLKKNPLPAVKSRNFLPDEPKTVETLPVLNALPSTGRASKFVSAAPILESATSREEERLEAAKILSFPVETAGMSLLHYKQKRGGANGIEDEEELFIRPPMSTLFNIHAQHQDLKGVAVDGYGLLNSEVENTTVLRKTRFAYTDGQNNYATLAIAVAADVLHANSLKLEPGKLKLGTRELDINKDGTAWVSYGGEWQKRFHSISLSCVLTLDHPLNPPKNYVWNLCKLDPSLLKNKIVMVGAFANGLTDSKGSPFDANTPGVIKHATELSNLISGRFIVDGPFWVSLMITFFIALLSAVISIAIRSAYVEIGWPVALFFFFYLVPGYFLVHGNTHILSAMPSLAGTFSTVIISVYARAFMPKEREELRELFIRYMEKDSVEEMIEKESLPALDGEEMWVTILTVDVKNFDEFSRAFRDSPVTLMQMLNVYVGQVTDILTDEGACIDKYIRSRVVAFFGAPVSTTDHAIRACKTALRLAKTMKDLEAQFQKHGWPRPEFQIALNTDLLFMCNVGSEQLIDYTALGAGMDAMPLIEDYQRNSGVEIALGFQTYEIVRDRFRVGRIDFIRLSGEVGESSPVYELLGMSS